VNTRKSFEDLHIDKVVRGLPPGHACIVPATELAMRHVGRPVPNAALLGALAALTGLVSLDHVAQAIREAFPGKVGDANVLAATAAFDAIASHDVAA
jgi:pyruvate ferredoxin oxidoreductase gamma subunit